MDKIQQATRRHATVEVKYHALYAIKFLGHQQKDVAIMFNKSEATISKWVTRFDATGSLEKKVRVVAPRKVTPENLKWLLDFYKKNPLTFLDEARDEFRDFWHETLSASTIWRVLQAAGLCWKVRCLLDRSPHCVATHSKACILSQKLERRAINIQLDDIIRFYNELQSLVWDITTLLFLDEVSLDNRSMRRTHGYGASGTPLYVTGEYIRLPRVSLLCFITSSGLIDCPSTEGTFTRLKFFQRCKELVESGAVSAYPGPGSIWILDGVKIHCHPDIINYLRAAGIVPIFLPAYCPFYNLIEIFFGIVKCKLRRHYQEGKMNATNLEGFVMSVLAGFVNHDMSSLFNHCGYLGIHSFNPDYNFQPSIRVIPE